MRIRRALLRICRALLRISRALAFTAVTAPAVRVLLVPCGPKTYIHRALLRIRRALLALEILKRAIGLFWDMQGSFKDF